ncbi:hypothetical protein BH09BAC5_BH09BAC5_16220 [soil metagenome]
MRIKILKVEADELVEAQIKGVEKLKLPSIHEVWRFNFPKHAKDKGAQVYILVAEESPAIIEGCLIYKMRVEVEPYMAYIEIAPHNKGVNKKYDLVAGCLIAFACRLSFILGKGDYKGWLAFDVREKSKTDQTKLMALYSKKYKALKFSETTMLIKPENGEQLIEAYLSY